MWKVDYVPGEMSNVEYHHAVSDANGVDTHTFGVNQKIHISLPINWWYVEVDDDVFHSPELFHIFYYHLRQFPIEEWKKVNWKFFSSARECWKIHTSYSSLLSWWISNMLSPVLSVRWEKYAFSHVKKSRVSRRGGESISSRIWGLLINWLIFSTLTFLDKKSSSWF